MRWTTKGTLLAQGQTGNLCARLPLPPGCAPTLWQNDEGYHTAYLSDFPGWYRTGDAGMIDADGDVWVMGRTDDIINVAGHRLSTGQMEEVLASHPAVAECAVVGAKDELKGQTPIGLVVLKAGVNRPDAEIAAELVALVRERIGPVAAFRMRAWCLGCRRHGRARSCADRSAALPMARTHRCRRPSKIPRHWRK